MGHFWLRLLWRKKSYPPGNGAAGEDVNEKSKVCSVREKREDKMHFLYPIARSGFLEQNRGSYLMEEKEKKKANRVVDEKNPHQCPNTAAVVVFEYHTHSATKTPIMTSVPLYFFSVVSCISMHEFLSIYTILNNIIFPFLY